MPIPTERRLALAVQLDELDTDDHHALDQYVNDDRLGSEAFDVVDTLIEIASAALDECQQLERIVTNIHHILDGEEWSADHLDAIAEVLTNAGLTIQEPPA